MTTRQTTARTANAKRNIVYGLLQVIVSLILPFVVRTVLIYRFGVDYLGLNALFTSILTTLSVAELGFESAIIYSLYRPIAEDDRNLICAYLAFYKKIYRIIGLVILGIGICILPALPFLVKDTALPGDLNLYLCYTIFLGDSVLSYLLFGYLTALPVAFQRRDIISKIDMSTAAVRCVLQCLLLMGSDNFYFYLLSIPAVTILRNLLIAIKVRDSYPQISCRGLLSREHKQELYKKVYGLFVNKLFAVSRNGIDCLCISAFIGLAMTGIYNNYFYILTALVMFSVAVCNSIIPGAGNSIATESREKNYQDMRRFDFIYMGIAGWAATCLLCLYQPFMYIWVGEELMLGIPEVIGLSLYYYILKMGDIRWVYHEAAGLWWECRYIAIAEAVANVVLNIVLCMYFGVLGIIAATILSLFFINFLLCPVVLFRAYFRNGKVSEYFLDHLWYFLTMLPGAVLSFWICTGFAMGSISLLGVRLVICTAVSAGVFWIVWGRSERYRDAKDWLAKARRLR